MYTEDQSVCHLPFLFLAIKSLPLRSRHPTKTKTKEFVYDTERAVTNLHVYLISEVVRFILLLF